MGCSTRHRRRPPECARRVNTTQHGCANAKEKKKPSLICCVVTNQKYYIHNGSGSIWGLLLGIERLVPVPGEGSGIEF